MSTRDSSWLVEETTLDEPADLLTIAQIRQHLVHEPHDDELGLRSLLDAPEAPPSPWWDEQPRDRPVRGKNRRRRPDLVTAA